MWLVTFLKGKVFHWCKNWEAFSENVMNLLLHFHNALIHNSECYSVYMVLLHPQEHFGFSEKLSTTSHKKI